MTRLEQIADLQRQYANAIQGRKWGLANRIYARLCSLMTRQLNYENRKAKAA